MVMTPPANGPDPIQTGTTASGSFTIPPQTVPGNPLTINLPPTPPTPPAPVTNEQLQRMIDQAKEEARKEEKDKLYPQIEELKTQMNTLAEERQARLDAAEEAQRQAAEAERLRQEGEMSAVERVEQIEKDWGTRFEALQRDRDMEATLRAREAELAQINQYKFERLNQEKDNIIPQMADFVSGNTKEEIDASIQLAVDKSNEIAVEIQQSQLGQRRQGAPPVSGVPPVDLMGGEQQTKTYTAAELREMPLDQYNTVREQLLQATSRSVRENGLYGG